MGKEARGASDGFSQAGRITSRHTRDPISPTLRAIDEDKKEERDEESEKKRRN